MSIEENQRVRVTPQNIYDNPVFSDSYRTLREMSTGLNEIVEQPALWSMLPRNLSGMRVLDIGCGYGDFARRARALSASQVLGIDISERMLERAKELTVDHGIEYRRMSIEELDLKGETFDLVVSSLTLHYVEDYEAALEKVARLLKTEGDFVLSVEHPMCTARSEQQWIRDDSGHALYWPVDCYRPEGERKTKWFVENVVKYHRTVETYVNGLIDAGFRLKRLTEPEPVITSSRSVPEVELHRRRPPLLVLAAVR
ncbi:MAG: class I SAM-dependent methyltransferase [Terracidiphilus sp.]